MAEGRLEKLYQQLRTHPLLEHLIPIEARISFPVPDRRADSVYLRFLVFSQDFDPTAKRRVVYRPFARLAIESSTEALVEYADLCFLEGRPRHAPEQPAGEYGPRETDMGYEEAKARERTFLESLETCLPLIGRTELSPAEQSTVKSCRELFTALIEPGLASFYRALSPGFFGWLNAVERNGT